MLRAMRRERERKRGRFSKGFFAAITAAVSVTGTIAVTRPAAAVGQTTYPASTRAALADPDTFNWLGTEYTFGSSEYGTDSCGTAGGGPYFVPYVTATPTATGATGSNIGQKCYAGDAMPFGPGLWADVNSDIWAPGVEYFGGTFYMYYSALKAGTGQRCVGRATSASVTGPYKSQAEWACPPQDRWAIDPDPFIANGQMYVAYRDDAVSSGNDSGISIVRTGAAGFGDFSTRVDALKGVDVGWNSTSCKTSGHLVENPAVTLDSSGTFFQFFSTGCWYEKTGVAPYATGISACGTSPLPYSMCTVVGGNIVPNFAYSLSGLAPIQVLPGDHPGPGGMSLYKSNGNIRASWHWYFRMYVGAWRYSRTGTVLHLGSTWKVA